MRAIVLTLLMLTGCATEPPKPLEPAGKALTPWQCEQLRARGGEC